jgi:formate hydrogenlyase subunit 6/NADH:ubiquinone oxidoreductase subunit I
MPLDVLDRLLRPIRRGQVTGRYPEASPALPPAARRLPQLDTARCDVSATCAGVCPTGAIVVTASSWSLDAGRCVFCGACARACPRDAIRLDGPIELAARYRDALEIRRGVGQARGVEQARGVATDRDAGPDR